MTGSDPRSEAAVIAATPLPSWAAGYKFEVRPDGRLFMHAVIDGCDVWAQPKAWSNMTFQDRSLPVDSTGTLNYGVNVGPMREHKGQFETNDAAFGRKILDSSSIGQQSPLPFEAAQAPTFGPYTIPTLIIAGGLIAAALISRFSRKDA